MMNHDVGQLRDWILQRFAIESNRLDEFFTNLNEPLDRILGRLIDSGLIRANSLAYYVFHDENRLFFPQSPSDFSAGLFTQAFLYHGWVPKNDASGTTSIACLQWPSPVEHQTVKWLLDKPISWTFWPKRVWDDYLAGKLDFKLEGLDPAFIPAVLEPWTLNPTIHKESPIIALLLESIRRRRTHFTLRRQGEEQWLDFHTPQIPIRPHEAADFNTIQWSLKANAAFHSPAFLPHETVLMDLPMGARQLTLMAHTRMTAGHSWLRFRLVDSQQLFNHTLTDDNVNTLSEMVNQWLSSTPPGAWIANVPRSPLSFNLFRSLLRNLQVEKPIHWIGIHHRLGRWPELTDVLPLSLFPAQVDKTDTSTQTVYIAQWDWDPEILQTLLLSSHRVPLILLADAPSPYHFMHYLWRTGFDSLVRAGKIRAWIGIYEPMVNCNWCAENFHPPKELKFRIDSRTLRWDPTEIWRRSLRCEACQDRKIWQDSQPIFEWGLLPPTPTRSITQFSEIVRLMTDNSPQPIWSPLVRGVRSGDLDGLWVSSFLSGLSMLFQSTL